MHLTSSILNNYTKQALDKGKMYYMYENKLKGKNENKIYKLLDFSNKPRDIADPWYTGNFDMTYRDVVEGCEVLLEAIMKRI